MVLLIDKEDAQLRSHTTTRFGAVGIIMDKDSKASVEMRNEPHGDSNLSDSQRIKDKLLEESRLSAVSNNTSIQKNQNNMSVVK